MALSNGDSTIYEFDEFRVDLAKQALTRAGESLPLTPKVLEMLAVFVERPGELLAKDELMNRLWPDSFVEEANLAQNVAVLRKALGDSSKAPRFIVTVPGRGYRFVADVRRADPIDPGPAKPGPRIETGPPTLLKPRTPIVLIGGSALAAVLLCLAAWLIYKYDGWAKAPVIERTTQLTAWSGLDIYPAISPDGRSVAYSSDRSGSFEIYVRQVVPGARDIQITSDGAQNFQPAFSPDGSQIAFTSKLNPGIRVMPSNGGTVRQLTSFGSRPSWSPDGTTIAYQSDPLNDLGANARNAMPPSTIWTVSTSGGEPVELTKRGDPAGGHGSPSWSPDGRKIVFDAHDWADSNLYVYSIETKRSVPVGPKVMDSSDGVFSADGGSIYFVADSGGSLMNVPVASDGSAAGEPWKLFDGSGTKPRHISLDRSGKRLVYSAVSTSSNLWASPVGAAEQPGTPIQLTRNANTRSALPVFTPDGRRIVYQSFKSGAVAHLWVINSDGSDETQLGSRAGFFPTISRDGRTLWFISPDQGKPESTLWAFDMVTGLERNLFVFDEPEVYSVRVSPDGQTIAFNSKRSGTINVWSSRIDGSGIAQVTFDEEFAGFPAWSPDGHWLAIQLKRGGDTHVALVPREGGEIVQLTSEKGQSWVNAWAEDNDRIVFAGQRDGVWNVYTVSRSTREVKRLTDFKKFNTYVRYPVMSPAGDKVAYEFAETTGNIWMAELK